MALQKEKEAKSLLKPWMRSVFIFAIGFFAGGAASPYLSAFACPPDALSDGSICPPCPARNVGGDEREAPPLEVADDDEPIARQARPVACDATPCDGFFRYDGPDRGPNATEILRAEKDAYEYGTGKGKIFFPESSSSSPAECVQEWKNGQREWRGDGMSAWGEDLALFDAFFRDPEYWNGAETRRFYLEIGGHDGVRESNSRLFDACLGWDGLLVEPTIKNYQRMVKLRPNAHHLGMAPSCNSSGVAMFHKNLYTNAVANKEGATIAVHCGPLSGPLKQLGIRRIDFWSLDVEGSELGGP